MSRTYRRKNAWQEKNYVDVDFVKYTNRNVVNVSYYKKYENQPDEVVHKRLKNWYHSDCLKYWSEGAFKKGMSVTNFVPGIIRKLSVH